MRTRFVLQSTVRHAQLERWLGAGAFNLDNLDNLDTLHAGDTSDAFHAAADGKGATFTLLRHRQRTLQSLAEIPESNLTAEALCAGQ
jgi:hypothetical protein